MTHYVYILQCKDSFRYYGHTGDLKERVLKHSKGRVKSTQRRRPIELVYFEEMESCSEAFRREMQFKNGKTRKETIDRLIAEFSKEKCQGFNSYKLK